MSQCESVKACHITVKACHHESVKVCQRESVKLWKHVIVKAWKCVSVKTCQCENVSAWKRVSVKTSQRESMSAWKCECDIDFRLWPDQREAWKEAFKSGKRVPFLPFMWFPEFIACLMCSIIVKMVSTKKTTKYHRPVDQLSWCMYMLLRNC